MCPSAVPVKHPAWGMLTEFKARSISDIGKIDLIPAKSIASAKIYPGG
jgi:hypothetical protein